MNRKIKELVEQADIHFSAHHQHHGVDTAVIIPTDLEKFAELIIEECASVPGGYDSSLFYKNSRLLKEHFGVEE